MNLNGGIVVSKMNNKIILMKLIASFVGMIALLVAVTTSSVALSADNQAVEKVYVCKGPQSHRFHSNKECRRLVNGGESEVKELTLEAAVKEGYDPCHECF